MELIIRGYSGIGVEQVSQMVFDEAELAKLRQNAPDFKESYDMGQSHLSLPKVVDRTYLWRIQMKS
jgi:hypothetical protein